jgi:hypothetical protein
VINERNKPLAFANLTSRIDECVMVTNERREFRSGQRGDVCLMDGEAIPQMCGQFRRCPHNHGHVMVGGDCLLNDMLPK